MEIKRVMDYKAGIHLKAGQPVVDANHAVYVVMANDGHHIDEQEFFNIETGEYIHYSKMAFPITTTSVEGVTP